MDIDWPAVWAWDIWTWPLWEPMRNWLIAVGGLIALIFAARTYAMNSRAKREEQARKVYTRTYATQVLPKGYFANPMYSFSAAGVEPVEKADPEHDLLHRLLYDHTTHYVVMTNKSDELIGPIRVRVSLHDTPAGPVSIVEWLDVCEPSDKIELQLLVPEHEDSSAPLKVEIDFRDSSGRWWKRVDAHPIRRRWFARWMRPQRTSDLNAST